MDPKHPRDRSGQNRRRQAGTKATSARPATGGSGTRNRGWQSERGRSSGARPQAREKRPVRASPAGPVSALEVSPWSGQTVQVLLVGGRCVIGNLDSVCIRFRSNSELDADYFERLKCYRRVFGLYTGAWNNGTRSRPSFLGFVG
jgi:hypothetical protein